MRSVTVKLALAFLLVGIFGTVLVAIITGLRTRQEFDRFVANFSQQEVAEVLSSHYDSAGGWVDLGPMLRDDTSLRYQSPHLVVLDMEQRVVFGMGPEYEGALYSGDDLSEGIPIESGGTQVGTVLFRSEPQRVGEKIDRFSPENAFRRNVNAATIISATIAGLAALAMGILLARNLTRPIRELTMATQSMAGGSFGHQVTVKSRDEIGELASSFNQMSRDLAQASQLRKQMTADIAHDLRTPLTVLRGYTEGLKDAALHGSPELYGIMHGEVIHLQHLVEDLRTLSLADAGELTLEKRAVDPKALLERTGLAYVMQAEQRGVLLRVDAPDDLPSIEVDIERMTQVLNNLVSNSLRFTTDGEIVLAADRANGGVDLQVRDTGAGVPEAQLPFIFDRFYRVDESRHRSEQSSTGLGLAIAKAIIEAHGARVTADSALGQGTTIRISFPG